MTSTPLIDRARAAAAGALKDQTRHDGTPFIGHPDAVAAIVADEIGLPEKSMVLLEQIRTIDRDRLGTYVSTADNETMAAINTAIRVSLGLVPPKPPQRPNGLTLCLCPSCASYFYQSKDHFIRRVDPNAIIKEPCDYCRLRQGYDYTISPMHGHRLPHS